MKKYVVTALVTAVIILSILSTGSYLKSQVASVNITTLEEQQVQNSITCSGKIEATSSQTVYTSSVPAVVEQVYIQVGDTVEKGDVLFRLAAVQQTSAATSEGADETDDLQEIIRQGGHSSALLEYYQSAASAQQTDRTDSREDESAVTLGDSYEIVAPASGMITSLYCEENSLLTQKTALAVIGNNSDYQVCLSVSESQIADLQVGQEATITGVGFKDSTYHGVIMEIADSASQTVSTSGQETVVEVLVSVQDAGEDLKVGLTAKCQIVTSQEDHLLVAPYEAVRADNDGSEYVYCYENGRAIKCYVQTGREFEEGFEVLDGLQAGCQIILSPDLVEDRQRVILQNGEA